MSSSTRELWLHAQSLPETTECERRTKISRSYYALFTHACIFNDSLPSEGLEVKAGSGCHRKLIQKLTNPTAKDPAVCQSSRQIGTQQMLAYDLRLKADYEMGETVTPADVKKCLRYVEAGFQVASLTAAAA